MTDADEYPTYWHCVLRSDDRRRVDEAGFVLTAVGVDNHIGREEREWSLWVPFDAAERARQQLDHYWLENRPRRPPPVLPAIDSGWPGVLGFLLVIWMLPTLEHQATLGWAWRDAGHMHAGSVMAGEWWRTFTALTLHGDIAHLLGNSIFGALFGVFLGRNVGSGLAWLMVVVCGALGNGLNAWLQPDHFRSVGASTANFAALALLGAFVWRRGYYHNLRWQRSFAPVAAAIALLAFTGVGGERTDVVAHFTGFLFGLLLGAWVGGLPVERIRHAGQLIAGALALGLIALAWWLAGTRGAPTGLG
jgi:rhomboid protease GluP